MRSPKVFSLIALVGLSLLPTGPIWGADGKTAARLSELGYLTPDAISSTHADGDPVRDAATRFLSFNGFAAGDNPTETAASILASNRPRCGRPDFESKAENAGTCRWPHLGVRFYQSIKLPGLTDDQVAECYRKAVQSWADVCGIEPQILSQRAGANVASAAGPIDGAGRTLAYAYLPCGASEAEQLTQLYDAAERWTPTLLQEVIAHELGHSLGLDHAKAGNLMQPYATGTIIVPQAGDASEASRRYGNSKPKPKPPADPTPKPDGPITITGELSINGKPYTLQAKGDTPAPAGGFDVGALARKFGVTWERLVTAALAIAAAFFGLKSRAAKAATRKAG